MTPRDESENPCVGSSILPLAIVGRLAGRVFCGPEVGIRHFAREATHTVPFILPLPFTSGSPLVSEPPCLSTSCVSPANWFALPRCREILHVWADVAVIIGVVVGLVALGLQWWERSERRNAVDAFIRALASRAMYVWRTMLGNRPVGDPEGVNYLAQHVAATGESQGELLASLFTGIAAQVPGASRSMRPQAREVSGDRGRRPSGSRAGP